MTVDRKSLRTTPVVKRRPAAAIQRSAAAGATTPSPAGKLRERLGNRASQILISRAIASPAKSDPLPARVSKPNDPAELEAEETARKIARMQQPPQSTPKPQKEAAKGAVQRAEAAPATPVSRTPSSSRINMSGGAPLPASVRSRMEPRFGANFGSVRIHTGQSAAQQSANLNARAFTVGGHIFFGKDKFQPQSASGRELIAHELTHTIQQGAVVQRSIDTTVTHHSEPHIQRNWIGDAADWVADTVASFSIGDAIDWIADKANLLPGFRLLTIVLGMNPINLAPVERSGANILRALLEVIPVTGALIAEALDNYGILDRVGAWMDGQVRTLGLVGSSLKSALDKFLNSLSWTDVFSLDDVYERGKRIFTEPIDRLIDFGISLASDILGFIRDAILVPLARLAEGRPSYDLLKAVLGQDPITGAPVPRTPETLIGGFMKLIGREEVWENVQRANAIPRAWAWFQGALSGLLGFVSEIPTLFMNALRSLEIIDLILPFRAFGKIVSVFGGFVVKFVTWAGRTVWNLLEIIFEVVSPGALVYIKRTGAALMSILRNPLPFVRNLVNAAKLGFENFADHFVGHLKAGLIDWLTGSLEGVYIPKALSLPELGKFAMSVLGISWAQIRGKIVKALGPNGETIMKGLETGFDIIVALVTGGPAAAWELIKEKLTDLKDQVVSGIIGFVTDTVVKKAIPKLISMFIPGSGFISAIISIYDTIMVFVEKISKIIQVVTAFLDSIVAIAGGNIAAAAGRVERILANLLSLAISFLAGFVGLGKVTDKINDVIQKVRGSVDKAIDAAITWIVDKAKKLGKAVVQAGVPKDPNERLRLGLNAGVAAVNALRGNAVTASVISPVLDVIRTRYGLRTLQPIEGGGEWWIEGEINPKSRQKTQKRSGPPTPVLGVPQAVKALREGSKQVTVRTEADGRQVVTQLFPEALERPGASVGSAYESGDTKRQIDQFRSDRQRLLVFHVDTKKYRVDEILPSIRNEIAGKEAAIRSAEEAISFIVNEMNERQSRHTGPGPAGARKDYTSRIATLNERVLELRGHLRNLQDAERSFERNTPNYRKLEADGVLYGHESVRPESHPHRTVPHINVEGSALKVSGMISERLNIDVTIYIAGT